MGLFLYKQVLFGGSLYQNDSVKNLQLKKNLRIQKGTHKRDVCMSKKNYNKNHSLYQNDSVHDKTTEPISLCAVAGLFSHTDASCVSLFVYCSSLCKLLAPEWLSTLHETTTWSMHALLRREPFPMSFFQHHRSLFTTISLFSVPQVSLFCNFVSCS